LPAATLPDRTDHTDSPRPDRNQTRGKTAPDDVVPILASIVPNLRKVLVDPDRVITASISISTSLIGPTFRSKSFPQNVDSGLLDLIYTLTRLQNNQKAWKKEVSDALMDPRFFLSSPALVTGKWVPLVRQYILTDRERVSELLARTTPPTAAGVLFGVGATSARTDADRRTSLTLRRIAFFIFAAETDTFVPQLPEIEDKLVELLSATPVSSPSSAVRAEVYLVLRALVLRTSPVHLSSLWPLVNNELQHALSALMADRDPDKLYTDGSILQACKLLDTLLVIAPDEFLLHEWLFVTDTIEAVYRPPDWTPAALVDVIAGEIVGGSGTRDRGEGDGVRKMWFEGGKRDGVKEGGDVRREVIAPWLRGLSIWHYEGTYRMGRADIDGYEKCLARDLFEEAT